MFQLVENSLSLHSSLRWTMWDELFGDVIKIALGNHKIDASDFQICCFCQLEASVDKWHEASSTESVLAYMKKERKSLEEKIDRVLRYAGFV